MTDSEVLSWLGDHGYSLVTEGKRWAVAYTGSVESCGRPGVWYTDAVSGNEVMNLDLEVDSGGWFDTPSEAVASAAASLAESEDEHAACLRRELERIGLMDREQLLNYMYVFAATGHKALQPWRVVLDRWMERVAELTGRDAWSAIESSKYANPYPGEYPYDPAARSKLQADLT